MSTPLDPVAVDLSPARWIWYPSQRTLPNTFILFRRELSLREKPARATGWMTADSRYLLSVNGRRVQVGPAPSDPRWPDVDPVDLTSHLEGGVNVLGIEVLFYGHGDGMWPAGKPGLICRLDIEGADGSHELVVSDDTWLAYLDRAHRPGHYKRWFVRALQEEFDARLHPYGWNAPGYSPGAAWMPAFTLTGSSGQPAASTTYSDYLEDAFNPLSGASEAGFRLRARQIPPLRETEVAIKGLTEQARVQWLRSPDDWFDMRVPGAFRIRNDSFARPAVPPGGQDGHAWVLPATEGPSEGLAVTFELAEQVVGWPHFTIEAPEGSIIELMCQEAHDPANGPWLDSQFYAWSRFICRNGVNDFMTFDFESLRWIQLHIRNASRPVTVSRVGVLRRRYDWPHDPHIDCDEPLLQRLFDAGINTLHNSAQETVVDGMARERQQYSGDVAHQLHAIRYAFGETLLPRRFLRTFSEGLSADGYFLDCWPAYDRLARISQRQVHATSWGPLLDHGVQFAFDCWDHYLQTGDLDALREPYPRLLRFAYYLTSISGKDGLLPVEGIGVPTVWMDHDAFRQQRHKQCAFNLNTAAMFKHALAPIANAFGESEKARDFVRRGRRIQGAAVHAFWSRERSLFVNNLPWLAEEGAPRLDDRSLATSVLFEQCPGQRIAAALGALADCPPEMGLSYPCNAGWRYWALARHGRIDTVLRDFRERWATMSSVIQNNTLQEDWLARPDSTQQWSHCAVAPLYVLFMDIAGIRPLKPGFARCSVRPQLGDLGRLRLTAHTARGPIELEATRMASGRAGHHVTLSLPGACDGELILPHDAAVDLPPLGLDRVAHLRRYSLPAGATVRFEV